MKSLKHIHLEVIEDLVKSLNETFKIGENIREIALSEMDKYPVFAPTYGDSDEDHKSNQARLAAIESLTRIFRPLKNESPLQAGILCASDTLTNKIHDFNDAKSKFIFLCSKAHRVHSISLKGNNGRFISKILKNGISDEISRIPKSSNLSADILCKKIDLLACRTKIRVMPESVDTISWTWSANHKSMHKITKSHALKLALQEPETHRDSIRKIIYKCPDEHFVKIKHIKEQLRANYASTDNNHRKWRSMSISGVVIVPKDQLPRVLWRIPPSQRSKQSPRLQRESSIYSDPFIKEINLYRYKT